MLLFCHKNFSLCYLCIFAMQIGLQISNDNSAQKMSKVFISFWVWKVHATVAKRNLTFRVKTKPFKRFLVAKLDGDPPTMVFQYLIRSEWLSKSNWAWWYRITICWYQNFPVYNDRYINNVIKITEEMPLSKALDLYLARCNIPHNILLINWNFHEISWSSTWSHWGKSNKNKYWCP